MSFEFKREDKYIVIKREDLSFLSNLEREFLKETLNTIGFARKQLHKNDKNKYIVVNQDEPYAKIIWSLIKEHEYQKEYEAVCKQLELTKKTFNKNNHTKEEHAELIELCKEKNKLEQYLYMDKYTENIVAGIGTVIYK